MWNARCAGTQRQISVSFYGIAEIIIIFHMQCSESDEHHEVVHPDGIVDNLAHFADMLLQHQPHAHLV